jgi:hypothetical protein
VPGARSTPPRHPRTCGAEAARAASLDLERRPPMQPSLSSTRPFELGRLRLATATRPTSPPISSSNALRNSPRSLPRHLRCGLPLIWASWRCLADAGLRPGQAVLRGHAERLQPAVDNCLASSIGACFKCKACRSRCVSGESVRAVRVGRRRVCRCAARP